MTSCKHCHLPRYVHGLAVEVWVHTRQTHEQTRCMNPNPKTRDLFTGHAWQVSSWKHWLQATHKPLCLAAAAISYAHKLRTTSSCMRCWQALITLQLLSGQDRQARQHARASLRHPERRAPEKAPQEVPALAEESQDSAQRQLSAAPHQYQRASSLLWLASTSNRSADSSLVSRAATDKEETHTPGECHSATCSVSGGGGGGGGGRGKSPMCHAAGPALLRDDADTYEEDEEDFIRKLAMQDFKDEARGRPASALQQLPRSQTLSGTLLPQSLPLSPPPPAAAHPGMEICASQDAHAPWAGHDADAPFAHPPPGVNTSIAESCSTDGDSSSRIWSGAYIAWRRLVDAVRKQEQNARADECRRRFDLLHTVLGDAWPEDV